MSSFTVAAQVAEGDDPGAFANNAAQLTAVPTTATASNNDYVAQFRAAFGNEQLAIAPAVFTAIGTTATTSAADLTDAQIVTYLRGDNNAVRGLLRNLLRRTLSDKEKAVLAALATGDGDGLTAALDDTEAGFSNAYKTAVRALLNRYHVGNIDVAMTGGSIDSRGDGIRAYYATPNANNGAISVTVADGASVTGARAGIHVANAGAMGTGAERILKQTVEVNGTVTGGTDAAVRLVGGGTLTVGRTGVLIAGSSGRAIWASGRAVIRIDNEVRGGRGGGAEAVPAVHLTGANSRLTVGPAGRIVRADGAELAIRRDGAGTRLIAIQDPALALADGRFTQASVDDAIVRLGGTVGGGGTGNIEVAAGEPNNPNLPSGVVLTLPDGEIALEPGSGYSELPVDRSQPEPQPGPQQPEPQPGPQPEPQQPGQQPGPQQPGQQPGPQQPGPQPGMPDEVVEEGPGIDRSESDGAKDIEVNVRAGQSVRSTGHHGILAKYLTPNDNNGTIRVTVAEGAEVTGARAGILVENAGLDAGKAGTADDILKQSVTVHGTVTGGTDAAVHLVGGGRLTVGRTGVLIAGSSGRAIWVNDPGRAIIRIDGTVRGGRGTGAEAVPAVHLTGANSRLTIGPTGVLIAGSSGRAIWVNDPGRAIIRIDGTVRGGRGTGAEAVPAVHLTGANSRLTIGPTGRVALAEGAELAIRRDGARIVLIAIQDPALALADGGFTQASVDDAIERLGGTVDGKGDGEIRVSMGEPENPNLNSGVYFPVDIADDEIALVPRMLVRFDCEMTEATKAKCRLYEALPSALLAMNGLPTYGERMAAARDGNGGWARIDGADGEWKAKSSTPSTPPNAAFDYRRYGVQAGVDFAVGGDGRFGVSVRGLQGSAEIAATGGEIELSGVGAGAHGTAFFGGGFHVDAQAMATWYDVDLSSGRMSLKDGMKGLGLALGVEAGRRMPVGRGVVVTPGVGLSWSGVDLSFARGMERVSVEDARSLVGRAGLRVELEAGLFGSLEATHEFSDKRSTRILDVSLRTTEAQKTGVRVGLGGARSWEDGRYALRAAAGYAARGSGNGEFHGGVNLAMRF